MESNNIAYLVLGITIGSFVDLKLIFALVVIFAVITNEPDFKGIRPRTLIASILYGIYLFMLNFFYNFSNKTNNQVKELNRIEEIDNSQLSPIRQSEYLQLTQNPEQINAIVQFTQNSQLMKPIQLSRNYQEIKQLAPQLPEMMQQVSQTPIKPIILNFNPISVYPGMKFEKK